MPPEDHREPPPAGRRGVARILALVAGLVIVAVVGLKGVESLRRSPSSSVAIDREHPGYEMYKRLGCHRCHGLSITGTHKAPTLVGMSAHWTLDELTRFFVNPDSVRSADPRIAALAEQFPSHGMPAYPIKRDALEAVGRFLLEGGS